MTWLVALGGIWAISLATILLRVAHQKWLSIIWTLALPHCVLVYQLLTAHYPSFAFPMTVANAFGSAVWGAVFLFHLPEYDVELPLRLRIMMGGRRIYMTSLVAAVLHVPVYFALFLWGHLLNLTAESVGWDLVVTLSVLGFFLFVGALRIFITSRRLGINRRILLILFVWVPGVNITLGIWFCRIVKQEFIHDFLQAELQAAREDSQICATRYPLLLLHGVGFRDCDRLNYWGRIPMRLKRNGATVYYGHQQAWGKVEDNAVEIQSELRGILANTGAEKVNIIAHSKGGLDARYLISSLNMWPHVATLTTMSTPHRGSELLQVLDKLPERIYRRVCRWINIYFGIAGDHAPNAYMASRQLHPDFLKQFNEKNIDAPGVYYQSYAAEMKSPMSHSLLMAPFTIMKLISANNDGLVTIDSAKWGVFKGTFKSAELRGISHGDLIDLMRQDYDGFNMAEEYVKIVAELKDMGY